MERIKLVVIAAVIGSLGLFGMWLWSGSSSPDEFADSDDEGGTRVARSNDGTTAGNSNMPRLGRNRGDRASGSRDSDSPGGWSSGGGSRGGSDSGSRRSGSADVVAGGKRSGGGSVGASGSSARGPGGSGATTHLSGSGTGAARDSQARDSSRSDLVDTLASQPKSRGTGEFAPTEPKELEEDVVLAVTNPEDMGDAVVNENVQASEDGTGIKFEDGSNVAFPADMVNADAGSIQFELEPEQWTGADATDNSFVQIRQANQWEDRLQIFRNGRYLRFIFTDDSRVESGISYPIDNWAPGDNRAITATWGDGEIKLFVDGQEVGKNTYPSKINWSSGTNLHLGSDVAGGFSSAGATIKNFKVYNRALGGEEVVSK